MKLGLTLASGVSLAFLFLAAEASTPAAQTAASTASSPIATARGPEGAPITILELSDFECPFCARMPKVLDDLLRDYPHEIRLIFKHDPLSIHPHAPLAHE